MVTSFLQGGLGNQIFQVAAAYNLAKKNKDFAEFNFNYSHTPNQGHDVKKYKNTIFSQFNHNDNLNIENIFTQKGHSFENIPYQKNLQLQGYFQSEKFFVENKNEIINKISLGLKKEDEKYRNIENFINFIKKENNKNIVSVHIRRGDYLKFPHIHTPCTLNYYEKSIYHMKEKIGDFIPIFVSDDKNWCKENFNGIISPFEDEIEDLILISLSDHNIIANSSFSWWGAYLNENKNKIVIGPKIWFGFAGPQDQDDTIPNNWIKI